MRISRRLSLLSAATILLTLLSGGHAPAFGPSGGREGVAKPAPPPPAGATKFIAAECNSGLSPAVLSNGGLTVNFSVPAGGWGAVACRASRPKWREGGKFYFEVRIDELIPWQDSIGVVNNGPGYAVAQGWDPTYAAQHYWTFVGDDNALGWTNSTVQGIAKSKAGIAFSAGHSAGFAFDLTADPRGYWVTPDVTGTGGCGGGPIWNGDVHAAPVFHASGPNAPCGGPGAAVDNPGTAVPINLRGGAFWPGFQFTNGKISATFNFGGSPFAAAPPEGFLPWDDPIGSTEPKPSPFSPQEVQIANAPEWQANHPYGPGDRVVAGPGWTPGNPGSYTSLQPLYLWAVSGAGGTAGTAPPAGFAGCASPTGYGGGFAAGPPNPPPQWSGHTTVEDNGIVWACLTQVDYVSITGASSDDPRQYTPGERYRPYEVVNFAGRGYLNLGRSAPHPYCIAQGATPETDTHSGCTWETYNGKPGWGPGEITYRSGRVLWPHELNPDASTVEVQFDWPVNLHLWYGGKQRPQYQGGVAHEADPIETALHDTHNLCWHDGGVFGWHQWGTKNGISGGWSAAPAPGDGFADTHNSTPGGIPLGLVDNRNGVTLYTETPFAQPFCGQIGDGAQYVPGVAWAIGDRGANIKGLQFWSKYGPPAESVMGLGAAAGRVWNGNILQSDGGPYLGLGIAELYANNILIYRGTGCRSLTDKADRPSSCGETVYSSSGVAEIAHYSNTYLNNTFIGPGRAACPSCVALLDGAITISHNGYPTPEQGNLFIGWVSPWSYPGNGHFSGGAGTGYIDDGAGGPGHILHVLTVRGADDSPMLFHSWDMVLVNTPGVPDNTALDCPKGFTQPPCPGNGGIGDYHLAGPALQAGSASAPIRIWSMIPSTYAYGNIADNSEQQVKDLAATMPASIFRYPYTTWQELILGTIYPMRGTRWGAAASALIANPTLGPELDVRLKPGSPAIGASSAPMAPNGQSALLNITAHDVVGLPRSRYSAGATEALH